VKGHLAVSATWDEQPSREDVCILLREIAQAIYEGQNMISWEGEGYKCTWLTHHVQSADPDEPWPTRA